MMRILIVDDLSVDRFLLKSLLNSVVMQFDVKYDIQEASSGVEAVDECGSTLYDIIFMDMVMPKLDGIKATKKIREFNKDSYIIGVSSSDDEESKTEFIQAGANHFIAKPVFGDQLINLLQDVLSQKDTKGR